jgi:hypothetical protein
VKTETSYGEPSWALRTKVVELAVTRRGGHLAPVRFRLGKRTVSPFAIAPWAGEPGLRRLPPLLQVLRGDFFCFPFGGNARPWRGESHPPHGETANGDWRFVGAGRTDTEATLRLQMRTRIRPAVVEKTLRLVEGHTAVYCRHVVSKASGLMNLGHHATLSFPASGGRISTSEIVGGQVYPGVFEDPAAGGYTALKAGAEFRSLACVPLANGGWTDLTRYPAREGFEDLVMVSAPSGTDFAWTAVVFPGEGYAWFSLKDPRVLASTVLWHSNGGRHYFPWNGRHRGVLGLEEVTSHFHDGLCESVQPNAVAGRGIRTALRLRPDRPLVVNVIMGVAAVPAGFERVRRLDRTDGGIRLRGEDGSVVDVPVDTAFLSGGTERAAF